MDTEARLREWLRAHLARVLGVAPESIALDQAVSEYGLDSVDRILMAGELEEAFGIEIDPAGFIACDSFEDIIGVLARDIEKSGRSAASA